MNIKMLCALTLTLGILTAALYTACAVEPELSIENESLTDNTLSYTVSSNRPLTGTLICAVYDASGVLASVSLEEYKNPRQQWTVNVTAGFEKGMSRIFFWNSVDGMEPWAKSAISKWDKTNQKAHYEHLSTTSTIGDLLNHPAFAGFAEQMLPYDDRSYNENMALEDMSSLMVYHSRVNPENSVAAINRLIDDVNDGKQIFYDFYTEEEKAADPTKDNTGLFFYRGEAGKPFAVQCAGGAFAYVGSLHESMPHCVEVNKYGYNAFAIKYRVGGEQYASEDLAAAISFIIKNADELGVSSADYSVWGGSAGARMAADMGSYGTAYWGGSVDSRPATVVMAYTGRSDYTENDPPTVVVVGENDGIANPRTMERRVNALKALGIDAEFHEYPRLGHGFGIGLGTSAEGWVRDAVEFWEKHIRKGVVHNE